MAAGMRSPPMTNAGTPISRLFVMSTSACASVRALNNDASSRERGWDCISRNQYRLRRFIAMFFTCDTTT